MWPAAAQVAEVVKTVLTAEQPHLRNLTQHQAKTLLGVKLHDMVGDKTIAAVHDFVQTVRLLVAATTATCMWPRLVDPP